MSISLIALLAGMANANAAAATVPSDDELNNLDQITVIGTARRPEDIAGAIDFISPEQLELQNYSDIHRTLRVVPGVQLQEEEGYGLRPNIGLRGSGAERSSKIAIMEDGVLAAPAPYAAPSAYYFPLVGRVSALEVVRGPATIKYGPSTTGGAINMFSTPIPDAPSAYLNAEVGSYGRTKVHGWAGGTYELEAMPFDAGFLIETYQDEADGFKDLPDGSDTGFDLEDYVIKGGLYSKAGASIEQSLVFKYQHKEEVSNETYLGLTRADFEADPEFRYAASANDRMVNDRDTWQLTHNIKLSPSLEVTTIAYRTEFFRNWYKLQEIETDDFLNSGTLSGTGSCDGIGEILETPDACPAEYRILAGPQGFTSPDDAVVIRANNRNYMTQGIQSAVTGRFSQGAVDHEVTASIRLHEDEVDRFQDEDFYRIENGDLVLTTDNEAGTQANRLGKAEALALYIQDEISVDRYKVTAGLRYENIETEEQRWDGPVRSDATLSSLRENETEIVLPSVSGLVQLNDDVQLFAGVHRGFSAPPPSSTDGDVEKSWNYEAGVRYAQGDLNLELIGFFNDYENLLGTCTISSGDSDCVIGDTFNAGEVNVSGLEAKASYDAAGLLDTGLSLPVSLAYTYSKGEFQSDFASDFEPWGTVTEGDEIPYLPDHQLALSAGVIGEAWGVNSLISYVSEARDTAGSGSISEEERIDARTIVDVSAYYQLLDNARLTLRAENLFDETYVAASRPAGLRPGKPTEVLAGLTLRF